ncbi:TIGR00730 family Rossman fold protein [Domibacillus iocasae]|uniref:Cytokinin riboside 5'-monophosphate phosphoribohydrolase n=1 Tax=Domibacillus iocasae TaxID=1714016 RepID=A0A1E7DJX7_9BACI|nr:TIGR00730 family Rossman fold protein [Domibacillus iocasae]OES43397.1 Rossman fold protein, TIGR00730 family [Domibacillus iocasae]
MKRIAVFCGSADGASLEYKAGAALLGQTLAAQGIGLVYGGSSTGLMGTVADAVLQNGGEAIGVIPTLLEEREIAHTQLTELHIVRSMHERKAKMAELADAFIVLPGGAGTMEEFFEVFTWAQIGLHQKPIGLLNVARYFDPLVSFFDHMTDERFLPEQYRTMLLVDKSPERLIETFHSYTLPSVKTHETETTV